MRAIVVIVIVLFGAGVARAQIAPTPHPSRKMLNDFLLAEAQKHFDARKELVATLKPDDILKRQVELKRKFVDAIGGYPDKTPLNPQVVGVLMGDGFRVEKVIYESRPNHHVTANLYLPDGKGPFPGVLMPCGHSTNGKAAQEYQRMAISLAKHGLAALSYDPIGQGERVQLLADDNKHAAIKNMTNEHTLTGIGALLVGQSTAGYRIWDGIRSIDYLASRPEIDASKIGCTGNSGGGTLTAYLMALDERIACAAPSCYVTSLERLFATIGPQDAEQNVTGQVAFGMEHVDFLTMRAPRPTLMCIASKDFFDPQGSWTTFREASKVYGALGHGERVALFEYDDKHGFSKPRREAALRWMQRWLLGIDDATTEGVFPVFKDAELQCTRSGQVLADFKGISVFGLNVREAKKHEADRAKFAGRPEAERQAEIRRLLGLPSEIPAAKLLSERASERADVHRVLYESEKGILVPGLHFGQAAAKGPTVLYLPDNGLPPGGKLPKWLAEKNETNQEIWMFDLRGLGESAPGPRSGYFGGDFKEAFVALHLNRPLLGQRVLDVLSLMKALGRDKVEIVGEGVTGPIVLHAAALDPRIRHVTPRDSLESWRSVVEQPISYNELTNVVPGVLKVYDLPDLTRTLEDRGVRVVRHVSAP
jgi:cephalosporin-C deacetylase-like acetyl esterase